MSNKTITYLSIMVIAIGLIFLANGLILAWTEPASAPPAGNVPTPLNVGGEGQVKSGGLGVAWDPPDGGVGFFVLNGNVGIGTASPIRKLHVDAGSDETISIFQTQGNGGVIIEGDRPFLDLNDKDRVHEWRIQNYGDASPQQALVFQEVDGIDNLERMVIAPGGNVGIGTTNPNYKLEVNGAIVGKRVLMGWCWWHASGGAGWQWPAVFNPADAGNPVKQFGCGCDTGFGMVVLNQSRSLWYIDTGGCNPNASPPTYCEGPGGSYSCLKQ